MGVGAGHQQLHRQDPRHHALGPAGPGWRSALSRRPPGWQLENSSPELVTPDGHHPSGRLQDQPGRRPRPGIQRCGEPATRTRRPVAPARAGPTPTQPPPRPTGRSPPADQPQRWRVRRRALVEAMALFQVGGLAVGEPDPKAQVVVDELAGWVDPIAEHVEGAEGALLPPGITSRKRRWRGQPNPSGIGPDTGQPDRPLRGAG
jgi:hypothetical protein